MNRITKYRGIFEEWEVGIAVKTVRGFKDDYSCLGRDCIDDLVDECLKHWFFVRQKYSKKKIEHPKAFFKQVATNKLYDIVEERSALKRNKYFEAVSLDQFLEQNSDSPFLVDSFQVTPEQNIQNAELKKRIEEVAQTLNPQQQKLLQALSEDQLTIKEISIRLRLHRSTVYEEMRRIKEVFEKEGLEKYLR